ncbi:ATP-grasp domain-containing protein [Fictibacillus arsenicus]|uniref:Transcriptional regulator n=1 Tax=Fictibacillus arsenicus TaxID=255247 RepID=A0A1V3GDU3_9BACL|nr:ATP-grasp domain-containing protein [Fictibacillus arsenicus]OOE14581.1 transcriptional regulator [Fictibacillus arsenicus]
MKKCEANILFTSSGRRVSLINMFKDCIADNNLTGKIITADNKNNAPTTFFSDKHYIVSRVNNPNYINELVSICINENIKLLIPLIDTELTVLSKNRKRFDELGVKVLVSSNQLNDIAYDKVETYKFFYENKILTPKVYSDDELNNREFQFPLLIKPRNGSSSIGVTKVNNLNELMFFKSYIQNAMVQEFVKGEEYTIDVMVDMQGNIKTIVPRLRIETRAGEVSKGITRKDSSIIDAVKDVVKKLPGAVGCITLQCFKKDNGEITFIEINPRFGGGVPLAIKAGANFPKWAIDLIDETVFNETDLSWQEGLTMLRYDEAVFTEKFEYAN